MDRNSRLACTVTLLLLLLSGGVFAGETSPAPNPPDPQHSKIAKHVALGSGQTRSTAPHRLTWFEMVEIALSNLGLL